MWLEGCALALLMGPMRSSSISNNHLCDFDRLLLAQSSLAFSLIHHSSPIIPKGLLFLTKSVLYFSSGFLVGDVGLIQPNHLMTSESVVKINRGKLDGSRDAMLPYESQYIVLLLDDQLTNLSPPRNCMPPDVLLRESRQPRNPTLKSSKFRKPCPSDTKDHVMESLRSNFDC
ncbi:hypothetical protein Tco_0750253 [Tanacetum coccineum]|uniref:Uncharacterized protein n=1 Tax=Tanacetum coccineum TaxID=301880 RepID=A0ABQ4Z3V9_9ASTR